MIDSAERASRCIVPGDLIHDLWTFHETVLWKRARMKRGREVGFGS